MTTNVSERAYNFNAGPAVLPLPVLEKAKEELLNFQNTGMSVMEISHRSKEFVAVVEKAEANLRQLMGIPKNYEVLFLQGGASLQFTMVPMNLYLKDKPVDIIHSGYWTKKAIAELKKTATHTLVASSEKDNFLKIPSYDPSSFNTNASYFYITANNTIFGTQYPDFPDTKDVPLVADMTSEILSRKIDVSKFGLIFAGAQKNLGPSGLTVVIIRKDLAERCPATVPTMLQYRTHIKSKSLYNTPPTFAIYLAGLMFEWLLEEGGMEELEKRNRKRAETLYTVIDGTDFYAGPVEKGSRSIMNVVFRIKNGDEALEEKFLKEATANGFAGLKGHRSVGGLRASIYAGQSLEAATELARFMKEFQKKN